MAQKTGIIGAMEVEIETLKGSMDIRKTSQIAAMEFYEGTIEGSEVVLVKSGVGKVNAGICSQILISVFGVTRIINTGVAGSLDERIDIGDFVISTDAVYHDVDATLFGYKKGEIPQAGLREFPADKAMAEGISKAHKEAGIDGKLWEGRVCSGDQFVSDSAVKDNIKKEFDGLCTEMEGAAIAHVCHLNKIPFVIIRAISDKADGSDIVDYPVFEAKAAKDSAALTKSFLKLAV